jgi:hypothetical protein
MRTPERPPESQRATTPDELETNYQPSTHVESMVMTPEPLWYWCNVNRGWSIRHCDHVNRGSATVTTRTQRAN